MEDKSLDPRIQKLVASLYGELSDEEEREFQGLLAGDEDLRAEYEEMAASRAFLEDWVGEEPEPGSVFVEDRDLWAKAEGRETSWGRIRTWFGHLMPAPAWGFAGATAVLAVLILAGFRVDRVENGIAFRFGPSATTVRSATEGMRASDLPSSPAQALDGNALPSGVRAIPVSYVTQTEANDQYAQLMRAMEARLDEWELRRNGELAYVLQTFYDELAGQQSEAYTELRSQIEGVGLGLMAEQSRTNQRIQSLVDTDGSLKTNPSHAPPPDERGDQ